MICRCFVTVKSLKTSPEVGSTDHEKQQDSFVRNNHISPVKDKWCLTKGLVLQMTLSFDIEDYI